MKKVTIGLTVFDAQRLYDHMGTMPWAPLSWSTKLRRKLSTVLRDHWAEIDEESPFDGAQYE